MRLIELFHNDKKKLLQNLCGPFIIEILIVFILNFINKIVHIKELFILSTIFIICAIINFIVMIYVYCKYNKECRQKLYEEYKKQRDSIPGNNNVN